MIFLKINLSLFLILFFSNTIYAQLGPKKNELPDGLSLSNQLEYSYNTDEKNEILEDWFNLDYTYGVFSTGLRMEVFQPNDPNPSISRGKERYADIAYKYIAAKIGSRKSGMKIILGNYYESFGRGIILKSYEDRNIRIDNNLFGLSLEGNYSGFILKALSGTAANINNERKDIVHGIDLEYRGFSKLKMGASFVTNLPENDNDAATNLLGFRISKNINFMDIYSEYAVKMNNDIKESIFNDERDIVGRAFYANVNFYVGNFSILSELKYYDNFNFTSKDGTVQYNTSPAVIRDYSYILLNRHPHALNQNNERGFQVEGNYVLDENTNITLSYGLTKTIGENSIYNKVLQINQKARDLLIEGFGQIYHYWNEKFKTVLTLGYNEEASTNTKNLTPIFEGVYYLDEINSLRVILEHQQTTNRFTDEKYFSDVFTMEYLRSPKLSLSLVGEMKTTEPQMGNTERKYWLLGQIAYKLNDYMDLSLLIGSRQAGNICIGGVCRYEPEFEGVEIKLLTRLY